MKKIIGLLFATLAAAACEYPIDIYVSEVEASIVINGDVVIGGESEFTVGYVFPLDANSIALQNKHPMGWGWIEDSNATKVTPMVLGYSFVFDTSGLDMEGEYSFHFRHNGSSKEYASELQHVCKAPELVQIGYEVEPNYVVITADVETVDSPYFTARLSETWEYTAFFPKAYVYNPEMDAVEALLESDESMYYCWNKAKPQDFTLGTSEGLGGNSVKGTRLSSIVRTSKKMSSLYRAEVSVRGISERGYKYLENMKRISSMESSLFSPNPSEMKGNIVSLADPDEKVIGFVSVCTENSGYSYVPAANYFKRGTYQHLLVMPEINEKYKSLKDYLAEGLVPVAPGPTGEIYWGSPDCMDCTSEGGTKNKPEGWPNNHE